jgi:predicted Zn-dependent peptidase
MLFQRENPRIECEDLAAQVLATGKRMPLAEMVAKIDGVEMDDLARVARKVFVEGVRGDAKRELTVVARGPRGVEGCKEMVKRAWTAQGLMTGSL